MIKRFNNILSGTLGPVCGRRFFRITVASAVLVSFSLGSIYAQQTQTEKKDQKDLSEIKHTVPTTTVPQVIDAKKIKDQPEVVDTVITREPLNYGIISRQVPTTFEVEPVPAAKIGRERLPRYDHGYIKGGLGNYTTTYGEVYVNSARNRDYALGMHAKHFGSSTTLNDQGFSGFSDNEVDVYGKRFFSRHTLSGNLNFSRNVVHYYGFDANDTTIEKDITRQRFALFGGDVRWQSAYKDSSKIHHDIKAGYHYFYDIFDNVEQRVNLKGFAGTYIGREFAKIDVDADYYRNRFTKFNDMIFGEYSALEPNNATIIRVSPSIKSEKRKWEFRFGMSAQAAFDLENKFYFYPDAYARYVLIDDALSVFGNIEGGLQRNTYRFLGDENPFVIRPNPVRNANTRYNLRGGFNGAISSKITYTVSTSYSKIEGMAFYTGLEEGLNTPIRFNTVYDTVMVWNLHGEMSYDKSEKLKLLLKGDYYNYEMTSLAQPYYRPAYELELTGRYYLKDKFIVKLDVFGISERFASKTTFDLTNLGSTTTQFKLNGLVDVNLGAEYRYSKDLSAFINFNNIAAVRYYRWDNYPTLRFNILGGVTYSF